MESARGSIEATEALVKLDEGSSWSIRLGDILWEYGRVGEACAAYRRAIALPASASFAAERARGRLCESNEDWQGALKHYERSIRLLIDKNTLSAFDA
ncbi:MAG TPA: hypothetical protein VNN25_24305, partial [Thermoanaerobaculia bacterium]|nr:hypothetical protein [Thermoanaerobaculia bacterium]